MSMVLRLEKQLQHLRSVGNLEFLYECVLATMSNRLSLRAEDELVTEDYAAALGVERSWFDLS